MFWLYTEKMKTKNYIYKHCTLGVNLLPTGVWVKISKTAFKQTVGARFFTKREVTGKTRRES